jgi:hypothetical protein
MHANRLVGNLEKPLPHAAVAFPRKIPRLCTPIAPTEGETTERVEALAARV